MNSFFIKIFFSDVNDIFWLLFPTGMKYCFYFCYKNKGLEVFWLNIEHSIFCEKTAHSSCLCFFLVFYFQSTWHIFLLWKCIAVLLQHAKVGRKLQSHSITQHTVSTRKGYLYVKQWTRIVCVRVSMCALHVKSHFL